MGPLFLLAMTAALPAHTCLPMPAGLVPSRAAVEALADDESPVGESRRLLLAAGGTGKQERVAAALAHLEAALSGPGVTAEQRRGARLVATYVLAGKARDCTCGCCGRKGHQGEEPLRLLLGLFPEAPEAVAFTFFLGEEDRADVQRLGRPLLLEHRAALLAVLETREASWGPLRDHASSDLERVERALAARR